MKWNKSLDYSANRTRRVIQSNVLESKSYKHKVNNTFSNKAVQDKRRSDLYLNLVDKIDNLSKSVQKGELNQLRDRRKEKKASRQLESDKDRLQVLEKMNNNISNISHRSEREQPKEARIAKNEQEDNKFDVYDVKFEPLQTEQPKHLDKYIINVLVISH